MGRGWRGRGVEYKGLRDALTDKENIERDTRGLGKESEEWG
jgi:hypothetical protein